MGVRMTEVHELSQVLESQWLDEHELLAERVRTEAKADGVTSAGVHYVEEMLLKVRDEGIARIRSSVLMAISQHKARGTSKSEGH